MSTTERDQIRQSRRRAPRLPFGATRRRRSMGGESRTDGRALRTGGSVFVRFAAVEVVLGATSALDGGYRGRLAQWHLVLLTPLMMSIPSPSFSSGWPAAERSR